METHSINVVKEIYNHLERDPRTKKAVIEVTSEHGIVTLSGKVKDSKTLMAAEEIARQQPGVVSVVNELKVG